MPDSGRRIVVTGSCGLIGTDLCRALRDAGHQVVGLDLQPDGGDTNSQALDLLNKDATRKTIGDVWPFDVLIHTAALAHGQRPPEGYTAETVSVVMTRNLVDALPGEVPHVIFFSSVDVYALPQSDASLTIHSRLGPDSDYGRGKVTCEKMFAACANTPNTTVVRLAPVYDKEHLTDVAKRVHPPGLKNLRMRLYPEPRYSLCRIDTITRAVVHTVAQTPTGLSHHNVADATPYGQHTLCEWFEGPVIPLPTILLVPLRIALALAPGAKGNSLRRMYSKLFRSNVCEDTLPRQNMNGDA